MDALKAEGVALSVVSNKQDAAVQPLSQHFFPGRMDFALGVTGQLRRKPNPDMVWACVEALGVERSKCLFVGDSEVDFATARNAGVDVASVTWGFRDRAELEALKPDYLVDRPEEILEIVQGSKIP
jgi:phosphoglycolate phosphatase